MPVHFFVKNDRTGRGIIFEKGGKLLNTVIGVVSARSPAAKGQVITTERQLVAFGLGQRYDHQGKSHQGYPGQLQVETFEPG